MSYRGGHIIYQSLVEPLRSTPVVETITMDKWFVQSFNPMLRKSLQTAILAGSLFFLDTVTANDANARVPEWHPQTNQPQRLVKALPRQNLGGEVGILKQCQTVNDDHFDNEAYSQFDLGSSQTQVAQAFTSIGGKLSGAKFWLIQTAATSGNIRAYIYQDNGTGIYGSTFKPSGAPIATSDNVNINAVGSDWTLVSFQFSGINQIRLDRGGQYIVAVENTNGDSSNRLRIKISINGGHSGNLSFFNGSIWQSNSGWDTMFYVDVCAIADGEVPQYWFQPISQPRIVKTPQLLGGESRFEVPRTILLSDWFRETEQPRIVKRPQLLGGDFRTELEIVVPETITLDKWWQPAQQPYFSKRRNYFTGEFRFEIPRDILLSDWFQEIKQPYFGRRTFYHTGESRFEVPRTILLSDWWQPASQPYFSKRRDSFTGELHYETLRTVLLSDWFREIVQPYFAKRRDPNTGEFRFEVPREILVTDWFREIVQPRIVQVRQLLGGQFMSEFVAPPEVITLDKWFEPIVQPYLVFRRNPFGHFDISLDFSNPTEFDDGSVFDCCVPLVIPFIDTEELVINYNIGMRAAYGDVPTVIVYHLDEATGQFIKANIAPRFVNYPATKIKINNGGAATGYVKIGA